MTSARSHLPLSNGNNLRKAFFLLCLSLLFTDLSAQRDKFRVQLLLPLHLNSTAELKGSDAQWQKISLSYYQGVLFALDSLERAGFRLQLFVDDYHGDTNEVVRLMNHPDRQNMDLIIGPLYKNGFAAAERIAAKKKAPILSPFLTFQAHSANEFTLAANPTFEAYGKRAAEFLNRYSDTVNIVLIHDNSKTDKSFTKSFSSGLKPGKPAIRNFSYSKTTHPAAVLQKNMYNWVVISSNDERTVNNLLYKLHDTLQDYRISVLGMQSWLDFSNVNYKLWDALDMHLLTSYFINYEDSAVRHFVHSFRRSHHIEPDEYVFRGYDQFLVLLNMMKEHGKNFHEKIIGLEYPALHTRFRFNREGKGSSLENEYLNILRYESFHFYPIR
jgi:ABC-type branched-subunit amino acid transport system substrate-binding protein